MVAELLKNNGDNICGKGQRFDIYWYVKFHIDTGDAPPIKLRG